MAVQVPAWLRSFIFYTEFAVDYLLVASVLFPAVYSLGMLLASFVPRRLKAVPNAWFLPALFGMSLVLPLTSIGNHWAIAAGAYLREALTIIPAFWGERLLQCLFLGWFIGAIPALLRFRKSLRSLRALREAASTAPPDPAFVRALRAVGQRRPVALREVPGLASPASWGMRGATVFIPSGYAHKHADDARYAVYVHELVHIKRRDSLKLLLLAAVRALFWCAPLLCAAAKRYRQHLEIVCDRSVLRLGALRRHAYASLLVESLGSRDELAPGFSAPYAETVHRLGYILDNRNLLPAGKDRLPALLCLAILLPLIYSNDAEVREPLPWGQTSVISSDDEAFSVDVVFNWHGILASYLKTRD